MKAKHILFAAFSAVILMVGCQREEKNLGFPSLDVFRTSMSFGKELASDTLSFVTTRAWKITSPSPWISFDPASGEPSEGRTVVTVTVLPNDSYDRVAKAEVNIGFTSVDVAVSQLGKGSADERFIFKNDFDKEPATQTGTAWPFLDKSDCWKNQKGSGIDNLKYSYSGMSTRNNSNSDGSYSDYKDDASGVNNLFFGSDNYFAITGLDVKGEKNLKITFGTEKYDNNDKTSLFSTSEFLVYVSKDTEKWVPVTYTYRGTQAGRWNIAEGTFTLSEAPASLSILFRATVASAYRIDDLTVEVAEEAGAALNLDDPAAVAFAVKLEGQDTPPTPVGDTFFVHDFKTGGQGEFTINDVTLPTGFTSVWTYDSSYGQMKATAFDSATKIKYAAESWVISPEVDLTSATEAYIEFEHTGRYFGTIANEAQLMISKDGGSSWNALAISNYPSGNDWTFVSSGKIGLASYVGSKIKFAFKYTSTEAAAGTWEIQKVTVGSGSGQVDPVDPVDPTGSSIKIGALSKDLTWNAATDTAYGAGFTGENDNVTISYFKNKSTTTLVAPDTKYDNIKVYKNAILIVSLKSGKTITGIKMNCQNSQYCVDMSVEGGGTVKADGTTLTWTGSMKTFKAVADGGQIRPNDIEIFYAD